MKNTLIILFCLVSQTNFAQWTDISAPTNKYLTHAAFTDDLRGYVSSSNYNAVWRTLDGGMSWDSTLFVETVVDIDFSNPLNGAVLLHGSSDYKIKITNNGGTSWSYLNFSGGPFDVYNGIFTTNSNTYFLSSYNFIMRTFDAGANWDTVLFAGYPMSMDKDKIGDSLIFTGWDGTFMYEGQVTRSYDGGNTWNYLNTGNDYTNFDGSHFLTGLNGYAVYHGGWAPDTSFISYTNDGGVSWNEIYYDTSITFHDVYMKNSTQGFIAATEGTTGKIQYSSDGITYADDFTTPETIQRLYHAENTLYAIGSNGLVVKKSVPLGIEENEILVQEIFPNPANDFFRLENDGIVLLKITDIAGKIILVKEIMPNEIIPINDFTIGMYMIEVTDGNKISIGKLMKVN